MNPDYASLIRDIPDFPKKGIIFKDITPLLLNPTALKEVIQDLSRPFMGQKIDVVVGMESRGFMFGPAVAMELHAGFCPVRKLGKLPFVTEQVSYELEYGTDHLEIHIDAVTDGTRVLIVDDLIATGGTAQATVSLLERLGAEVVGLSFLIELDFLRGRDKFPGKQIHTSIVY
ncbi:MAG: adenine phosphoribosyltransferase [Acidobacteria bacterium]|nr:adenine phosphoribosyltransferase [Acidobacteriota bacterium]